MRGKATRAMRHSGDPDEVDGYTNDEATQREGLKRNLVVVFERLDHDVERTAQQMHMLPADVREMLDLPSPTPASEGHAEDSDAEKGEHEAEAQGHAPGVTAA